jgi:hypothetical protein
MGYSELVKLVLGPGHGRSQAPANAGAGELLADIRVLADELDVDVRLVIEGESELARHPLSSLSPLEPICWV